MRKIVKSLVLMLVLCLAVVGLSSCSSSSSSSYKASVSNAPMATDTVAEQPTTKPTTSSSKSSSSSSSFTNAYGTATTKCAHPGCNNPIASSGDTNCCTTHSKKCLECGKYIDEDATYCMSCIEKAATASKKSSSSSTTSSSSSSSSGSFTNAYGSPTTKCAYPGCNNPVASSGDTNCCSAHSNRCLNCGKLIDSDAMYCMSCLSKALQQGSSSGSGSSSSSSSSDWGSDYGSDWDEWSWLFDD